MPNVAVVAALTRLSAGTCGVFRARDAVRAGVSPHQIQAFARGGVIAKAHPGVYRLTSVRPSAEQRLHAALAWAGPGAAAAGRSAAALYELEGIVPAAPEIVVPETLRARSSRIVVHHARHRSHLMVRRVRGIPVTGVEATLLLLAHLVDDAALEIACEDARRRRLTSMPALTRHLDRVGGRGQRGLTKLRGLLADLDPANPSRSTLEVHTRRLLVEHGLDGFIREFPIVDGGRSYRYDFAFPDARVILETNGRRWHDDPLDYESDNAKWSVPGRHGFRIVFATWAAVTERPDRLVRELRSTRAAAPAAAATSA